MTVVSPVEQTRLADRCAAFAKRFSRAGVARLASVALVVVAGCAPGNEENERNVVQTSEAIINGIKSRGAETGGWVSISHTLTSGTLKGKSAGCTGSLLQNDIVLTARHCVTTDGSATGLVDQNTNNFLLNLGSQQTSVMEVFGHSTLDVAILTRLNFFAVNGSRYNFSRSIYTGTSASLVNQTLHCYGYGDQKVTDCANRIGTADGSLYFADIKVASANTPNPQTMTFSASSSSSPIQAYGDSGGTCLFGSEITGVLSFGECGVDPTTLKGSFVRGATAVGPDAYRSWATNFVNIRRHADTHIASVATISAFATYISDPDLNGHPEALLEVTPNWNPPGASAVFNDANVSTFYDSAKGQWAIFNQNFAAMPDAASFNYVRSPGGAQRFVATSANTQSFVMRPGLGAADNDLSAVLIVTPSWNGVIDDRPVGVYYDTLVHRWAVINEDLQAMPLNAAFNVWIADTKQGSFIHTTTAANVSNDFTYLDNMNTNNEPAAQIFVTHNLSPNGGGSPAHPHALGVFFEPTAQKWAIFNQDQSPMPVGRSFNVMIRP
jgi:hypothetical protein